MTRVACRAALVAASLVVTALPARAELVFFASGRTLSVASHRIDGDGVVLVLRDGGEMVLERSLIVTIGPDEVPYPERQVEAGTDPVPDSLAAPARSASLTDNPRYDPIIRKVAAEHGVDATIVRAVIQVESAYQPQARSRKGAVGLMQVMPATARQYGVRNPYDPTANIEAGTQHLKSLLDRFPLSLALAAYNAGEAAVERFRGIPPYPETQQYVSSILALLVP